MYGMRHEGHEGRCAGRGRRGRWSGGHGWGGRHGRGGDETSGAQHPAGFGEGRRRLVDVVQHPEEGDSTDRPVRDRQ